MRRTLAQMVKKKTNRDTCARGCFYMSDKGTASCGRPYPKLRYPFGARVWEKHRNLRTTTVDS